MSDIFTINAQVKTIATKRFNIFTLFYEECQQPHRSSLTMSMTLQDMAIAVLNMPFIRGKCNMTYIFSAYWRLQDFSADSTVLTFLQSHHSVTIPCEPARPFRHSIETSSSNSLAKKAIKNCKASLEYTIHGIANAESYAIDLFWDLIARFYSYNITYHAKSNGNQASPRFLPVSFFDDMVFIATQEADHFLLWKQRLEEGYNCPFGSLHAHNGLWQSATLTSGDLLARLAVINLTHEAKGLDTYDKTREKLEKGGDFISRDILERNYKEEIHHVATGVKWFKWLCSTSDVDAVETFHSLSKMYFKGRLYPPFNRPAREEAGLTEDWYIPLATGE